MTTECSDSNSESAARFERDAIPLLDDLYGAARRLIFTPFVKDRVCPHGCIASCTTHGSVTIDSRRAARRSTSAPTSMTGSTRPSAPTARTN